MTMWNVIGASVAGRSHEAAGRSCEDSSGWRVQPAVTCLAVADGAGSKTQAAIGSRWAIDEVLNLVCAGSAHSLPSGSEEAASWLRSVFSEARIRLIELAAAEGQDPDDYATTLCVAVIVGGLLCIGQIGDSIAMIAADGQYETVQPPPRHEYANETTFLTNAGALDQMRVTCFGTAAVDAVALSTDGLRFQILDELATAKPYGPFFDDLISYAASPDASSDGVRRFLTDLADQTGDDKSLVVAVRAGGANAPIGRRRAGETSDYAAGSFIAEPTP